MYVINCNFFSYSLEYDSSNALLRANVELIDDEYCRSIYNESITDFDLSFCAGLLEGGIDACQVRRFDYLI